MTNLLLFAQQRPPEVPAFEFPIWMIVVNIAIAVVMIVSMWKVFEKAGEPGWASIVPIYNLFVMLRIAGLPAWWFILCFIPCVFFVPLIMLPIKMAEKFGKDIAFGIILLLLPYVGYPILAFGDAKYRGTTTPTKPY